MKGLLLFAFFLLCGFSGLAQDSLLVKLLQQNKVEFAYAAEAGFSGAGWEKIIKEANHNQYFLIGETHGINELPLLIDGITKQAQFQTYVAEIDPWLAQILEVKVSKIPAAERQKWYAENNAFLSFYSYQNDFKLLQTLAHRNIRFAGIDQITLLNDVLVYEHLATLTRNKKRKEIYLAMAAASRQGIQQFDPAKSKMTALYLASKQFPEDLKHLRAQKLTAPESKILDALEVSAQIYSIPQGHYRRINLMKQQLMDCYTNGLIQQKTLFRMGAMHSSMHESFFTNFDVGNLAHNLAESQNKTSYHVAVMPKTGTAALPFKGMPASPVKPDKNLSSIFSQASDKNWTYFDLRPIREMMEDDKLKIDNKLLRQIIKGYDGFIVVPVATASEF